MNRDIEKLIAQIVARDISDALDVAPEYPHQATFAIPYYKNQLVVRVVNGVLHHYFSCHLRNPIDKTELLIYFLREPLLVETIVKESFFSILKENKNWTDNVEIPDSVSLAALGTQLLKDAKNQRPC